MFRFSLIFILSIFGFSALAGSPRLHNHAPEFVKFWEAAKDLPLDKQIEEFDRVVYPTFPEFYSHRFQRWAEIGKSKEEGLKKTFDEYRSMHSQFIQKTDLIGKEIESNLSTFLSRFPDLNTDFDIYIIHSLGEMDGGTRIIDGKFYFIFGIDGIIKYHNASTDIPFFHHELFHVYHWQYFKNEDKIWLSLWAEGLATYVSEVMNPGSSLKDIMLDIPVGLVDACEKDIEFLWADMGSYLDSNDEGAYERYFLLSSKDKRVPLRAGYYLGYLLAKDLAKNHTVDELVKMDTDQLRKLIGEAVASRKKSSSTSPSNDRFQFFMKAGGTW